MFVMCNVVWYEGIDAYCTKFILEVYGNGVSEKSRNKVISELEGNGELLKIDELYFITLYNVVELKESDPDVFERFNNIFRVHGACVGSTPAHLLQCFT